MQAPWQVPCSARAAFNLDGDFPVLTRSFRRGALALALFLLPQGSTAQTIVPVTLTLEEVIEIARQNNPGLQATRNDEDVANWNVRSSYGGRKRTLDFVVFSISNVRFPRKSGH